jgi:hypothetical protein
MGVRLVAVVATGVVDGPAVRSETGHPALDGQVAVRAAAPPLVTVGQVGRGERVRIRTGGCSAHPRIASA